MNNPMAARVFKTIVFPNKIGIPTIWVKKEPRHSETTLAEMCY